MPSRRQRRAGALGEAEGEQHPVALRPPVSHDGPIAAALATTRSGEALLPQPAAQVRLPRPEPAREHLPRGRAQRGVGQALLAEQARDLGQGEHPHGQTVAPSANTVIPHLERFACGSRRRMLSAVLWRAWHGWGVFVGPARARVGGDGGGRERASGGTALRGGTRDGVPLGAGVAGRRATWGQADGRWPGPEGRGRSRGGAATGAGRRKPPHVGAMPRPTGERGGRTRAPRHRAPGAEALGLEPEKNAPCARPSGTTRT